MEKKFIIHNGFTSKSGSTVLNYLDVIGDITASGFIQGDKIYANGYIPDQSGSTASLQVNGFVRTGNIYLHPGGNTPNGTRTGDYLSNVSGELIWNGVTNGVVYHDGNLINPITGTGTSGQIPFFNGTTSQTSSSNFVWDNSNRSLGIGMTPSEVLSISSTDSNGTFILVNTSTFGRESGIKLRQGGTFGADLYYDDAAGANKGFNLDMVVNGNRNNSIFINSGGDIGLSKTGPSEKLDVNGNVKANNFIGSGSQLTGLTTSQITNFPTDISYFNNDSGYITGFTDDYLFSTSFNNTNGVITFTRLNGGTIDLDIDGRFSLLGHSHTISDITDFPTNLAYVDQPNTFTQPQVFENNVTIGGDLLVSGQTIQIDSQISTADAVIRLNDGELGVGVTLGYSGFEIDRGSEDDFWFGYDEVRDRFTVGRISGLTNTEIANTQILATRANVISDQAVVKWDSSSNQLVDTGEVFNNFALKDINNNFSVSQTITGDVTATNFIGNGSQLTNINPSNINNLDLDDVLDSATRKALTTGSQIIVGQKTFSDTIFTSKSSGIVADFNNPNSATDIAMRYGYVGFGWQFRYLGSGANNENRHELWSEGAGGVDNRVYSVTQDGNISFDKNLTATNFIGDGSQLTGLTTSQITNFPTDISYFNNDSGYITTFTDDYVTSASFNNTNGVITFTRVSGGTFNVDIDNRFSLLGHSHAISDVINLQSELNSKANLTSAAFIGTISSPLVVTREVRSNTNGELVLNVGESFTVTPAQTDEFLYVNAEKGLQINSSPDNWDNSNGGVDGWTNRVTTTINSSGIIWNDNTVYHAGNLTLSTLGYTGDNDANNYVHPARDWVDKTTLSGAIVISNLTVNSTGHPINWTTRALTLSDLGYTGVSDADNYNGWSLFVNSSGRGNIASNETVNFVAGNNINLDYSTYLSNSITINANDTTYTAGDGLNLVGTEFSHGNTSSQLSSNNSDRTYIQDILLDTYGHITGITTATETVVNTDTNYYLSNIAHNATNVSFQMIGLVDLTLNAATDTLAGLVSNTTQTFGGDKTFNGDVTVGGDLTVLGTTFSANTQTVMIEDNVLVINNGETGAGVTSLLAGIEVDRGTELNYQFIFDETDDYFKIGEIGDLQVVATRPYVDAVENQLSNYLPLSGGTLSGNLIMNGNDIHLDSVGDKISFGNLNGTSAYIMHGSTTGQLQIGSDDRISFFETDSNVESVIISTNVNTVTASGGFIGPLIGNADTSSKWFTPRTVTFIGDVSGSFSIDGSANVDNVNLQVGDNTHNHTSLTGITSLGFAADGSDLANISTTINGSSTYFDFFMTDDNNQEQWRWRFDPAGATSVYNAMVLAPVSDGKANLTVSGSITGDDIIGNLTGDVVGDLSGNIVTDLSANLTLNNNIRILGKDTVGTVKNLLYFSAADKVTVGAISDVLRFESSSIESNLGTIWGSWNDGSGSGLNADLLDGLNGGDFVRNLNVIDSAANTTFSTVEGITLFTNTAGSTGFPLNFGQSVHFSAGNGDAPSSYSRDFTLFKSSSVEDWFLRGFDVNTGAPQPWREIYHSGNSNLPTVDWVTNALTVADNITFSSDDKGVVFSGNARIYKKQGSGIKIRLHNGNTRLAIEDNSGAELGVVAYTSEITNSLVGYATENWVNDNFIFDNGTTRISDANTVSPASGKYSYNLTTLNAPNSNNANYYGTILNLNYDGNNVTQISHDIGQDSLSFRTLTTSTDTGNAWKKIYDVSNSNLSTIDWAAKNINASGTGNFGGSVLAPQFYATDGTDSAYLTSIGITFGRNTSYLLPSSNATKSLRIGGGQQGEYDWSGINVYTDNNNDFLWNDEIIATQTWTSNNFAELIGDNVAYTNAANVFTEAQSIVASGGTIFDIQGSQGQLFSISDSLEGVLFSVNDISGLPILEVHSDDKVVMGTYNTNTFVVNGEVVGIGILNPSEKLEVDGNVKANNFIGNGSQLTGLTVSQITNFPTDISYFNNDSGYITTFTDDYTTSASFNNTNGVITFTRVSGGTFNVDIDNRFSLLGHSHTVSDITDFPTDISYFNNDSGYSLTGHSHTIADITNFPTDISYFNNDTGYITTFTDDYVTSASFNNTNGIITFTRVSGGTFNVDIDNRFSLLGHSHTVSDITDFPANLAYVDQPNTFTQPQVFENNVTIGGNLLISGQTIQIDSQISTADAVIRLNDGELGAGITLGYAGFEIDRGSEDDFWFGYDENRDRFTVGRISGLTTSEIATTQVLATRADTISDQAVVKWDSSSNQLVDTGELFSNFVLKDIDNNFSVGQTINTSGAYDGLFIDRNSTIENVGITLRNNDNFVVIGANLNTGDFGFLRNSGAAINNSPIRLNSINGDVNSIGNVTASNFIGDGSQLTGLTYANIVNTPTIGNGTITISAGGGLITGGSFTTNQTNNSTITISHADTSNQGSVNNSDGTFIQDITLDVYGHITNIVSVDLDARYLERTGGDMSGLIRFNTTNTDNGFRWDVNSDTAGIRFKNTGDGDSNSYFNFYTEDNGNEYFKFSHRHYNPSIGNTDFMDIKNAIVRVNGNIYANATQSGEYSGGTNNLTGGNLVYHTGNLTLATLGYIGVNNADNYDGWDLFTDGVSRGRISSGEDLNFVAGANIGISYSTTNTNSITISANDTIYTAGDGLDLVGAEFSHADTSSQLSSNNSGRTYIQDILLDTYGHITGITTATETVVNTDTNYYLSSITHGTNFVTLTVTGAPNLVLNSANTTSSGVVTNTTQTFGGVKIFNNSIGVGNSTPSGAFNNGKAISIGDGDSGIRQNGDGIIEIWSNSNKKIGVTSTNIEIEQDTTIAGSVTANSIIKNGATNQDVLLGDGSTTTISGLTSSSTLLNLVSAKSISFGESYIQNYRNKLLDDGYTYFPNQSGYKYSFLKEMGIHNKCSIFISPSAVNDSLVPSIKGLPFDYIRDSIATYTDEDGVIRYAPNNVSRISYDENGDEYIPFEPLSTNLVPFSQDVSTLLIGTNTTRSIISGVNPDGTTNVNNISGSGGSQSYLVFIANTTELSDYTFSCWVKGSGTFNLKLQERSGSWTVYGVNSFTATTDWVRYDITVSVTTAFSGQIMGVIDLISSSLQVFGGQIETQSYATSYIPTSGSTVPRVSEGILKTGLETYFNPKEGVIYLNFKTSKESGNSGIVFGDDASGQRFLIRYINSSTIRYDLFDEINTNLDNYAFNVIPSSYNKFALIYTQNSLIVYINGVKHIERSISNPNYNFDMINTMNYGSENYFNGGLKELQVYNQLLTENEVQILTTQ